MNAILDQGRLADIGAASAGGQAGFVAEFRRSHAVDSAKLRAAAAAGDCAQVTALAHGIEGACRVLGAGLLAQASAMLAAVGGVGNSAGLQVALERFAQRETVLLEMLDAWAAQPDASRAGSPEHNGQPALLCRGLRFFVVEDHEFQRELLVRLLRRLGAQDVRGFADGAAALAGAREPGAAGAVLIIDLAMPGLNGIELAHQIGTEHLPVSVILNSALGEDLLNWPVQTARAGGVTVLGAIHKPVTESKLSPMIAQHRHNLRSAQPD